MNYVDGRYYEDLQNIRYTLPYVILTVYSGTLFLMHLLPRFQLDKKNCIGFNIVFFLMLTTACTVYGTIYGWERCNQTLVCRVDPAPYCVAIAFVAVV